MKIESMHSLSNSASHFSDQGVYPCPVCRCGQISTLPLMDAMACQFCRHIFTANLEKQQIQTADRQPPLVWRWNGKKWSGAHIEGVETSWGYWLLGLAFVVLPSTLLGITAYTRPPVSGIPLSWLPIVWTGLAFLLHLAIIIWLVIEFYQFPVWAYLKTRLQNMFGR
jgi:hypothetical protein